MDNSNMQITGIGDKKKLFSKLPAKYRPVFFSLAFAVIGTIALSITYAATSPIYYEPETGTVSGSANIVTDSATSGGKYIQFGGTATPPVPVSAFQPSAPYYATFFYPWYKNTAKDGSYSYWQDSGNTPPKSWFSHYLPDIDPTVFSPSAELYSSNDYATFKWQMSKLAEAKQEVAIASWFGQGSKQDIAIKSYVSDYMKRADNPYPNLRWALYYECEGITSAESGDCQSSTATPTVDQLVSDLTYLKNNIATSPYVLKINDKPVVFVYGSNEGVDTLQRWRDANTRVGNYFYVVQKVFSGYATAVPQPDSWHQYAPAVNYQAHGSYSAFVSPGFWKDVSDPTDGAVRLARDLNRFKNDVVQLVNANTTWKLVQTWNEWGEGSSVEPGTQSKIDASGNEVQDTSGAVFGNAYVQALADRLPALESGTGIAKSKIKPNPFASVVKVIMSAMNSVKKNIATALRYIASAYNHTLRVVSNFISTILGDKAYAQTVPSFIFGSGGDIGANSTTTATLAKLDRSGSQFFLALGDMDYDETASDAVFCDYVKGKLPTLYGSNANYPFQILTGNHEEQGAPNGYIMNHAACLPDRMQSKGAYPAQYYFDYPNTNPLMRVIMISPNLIVENIQYNYAAGTTFNNWLVGAIDEAHAAGIPWVTVGMHKNCISAGVKSCEINADLINTLVNKKVDVILQGHEHNYQRTAQLAINGTSCTGLSGSTYNSSCVVPQSNPDTYLKGAGPLILIHGIVGRSGTNYPISTADPSYAYMVKTLSDSTNRGFVRWNVTADKLDGQFVASAGTFADSFTKTKSATPPAADTTVPTVAVTSPTNGTTVSSKVSVTADANDNIGVTKVEFYIDGVLSSTSTTKPYQYVWDASTFVNGSHTIQAKAYDSANNNSVSSVSTVTVANGCTLMSSDFGKVSSSISLPVGNYTVWVRMMASDANNNSVGLSIGTDCPYVAGDNALSTTAWTWVNYKDGNTSTIAQLTTAGGTQSLIIYGREAGVKVDRVVFISDSCVPTGLGENCAEATDTTPPTVAIATPINGATVSGTTSITANASDSSGITKVDYYIDNLSAGTKTTAPYTLNYDTATLKPGLHTIKVVAFDAVNNSSTAQVSVTVKDVTAPVVAITSPALNAQLSGPVSVTATATDNGILTSAEFYIDGQLYDTVVGAGPTYMLAFDSKSYGNGQHTLGVIAYDSEGNLKESTVTVTFDNDITPPSVPTNVQAKVISSTQAMVSWSASTDNVAVAGYYVARDGVVIKQLSASQLSYSDPSLTASTTYSYTVIAYDAAGYSSNPSQPSAITTPAAPDTIAPSVPTGLLASAISSVQVNLSWNASTDQGGSGLAGYRVMRDGIVIADIPSTSLLDGTVNAATQYRYSVVAYDKSGNSSQASIIATVTTPTVYTVMTLPVKISTADAYIASDKPTVNFGKLTTLNHGSNPLQDSVVKFVVNDINGRQVVSAKLRFYGVSTSAEGGSVWETSYNNWNESRVTWRKSPSKVSLISNFGAVTSGSWTEVDVTSLVNADGIYSVRISSQNSGIFGFSSRESSNAPQLVVSVK